MKNQDFDGERRRLNLTEREKGSLLVNPKTLKAILAIGPWAVKILRLVIELVKLFR